MCFCCDVIESCSVVCVGEPWLWGVSDVRLAVVHRHKQTLAHLWELEGASKNRAVPESMMYSMWWIILFSKGEGCHSSVYVWPYDTWFTFSINAVFFFFFYLYIEIYLFNLFISIEYYFCLICLYLISTYIYWNIQFNLTLKMEKLKKMDFIVPKIIYFFKLLLIVVKLYVSIDISRYKI